MAPGRGHAGAPSVLTQLTSNDVQHCKLQGGDKLLIYTPGGGGFGESDDQSEEEQQKTGGNIGKGKEAEHALPARKEQHPPRRATGRVHSWQSNQESA